MFFGDKIIEEICELTDPTEERNPFCAVWRKIKMRYHLMAAVAAGVSLFSFAAHAEDFTIGTLKAYDHTSQVVTLDNGQSWELFPNTHPNVRVGQKVIVDWQSNLNGDDHADYVGPMPMH